MSMNVVAYLLKDAEKILQAQHIEIQNIVMTEPPREKQKQGGKLRVVAQKMVTPNQAVLTVCHQLVGENVEEIKNKVASSR